MFRQKRLMGYVFAALLFGLMAPAAHQVLAASPGVAAPATPNLMFDVGIRDFFFSPVGIRVPTGSTVRWTNLGPSVHTVTSTSGQFDSGSLMPGATYSYTFNTPGTFLYYCMFHRAMGMYGYVVVTGAPVPAPGVGGNLARGRSAFASSEQPGMVATMATDGNLATMWRSARLPAWIYVDLGRLSYVDRAVLRWGDLTATARYWVFTFNNGGWWSAVYSGIAHSGLGSTALFRPVITRYVLVYIYNGTLPTAGLRELEVYWTGSGIFPYSSGGGAAPAPDMGPGNLYPFEQGGGSVPQPEGGVNAIVSGLPKPDASQQ